MTHVVIDNCNQCKFTDCVMVCPVDCFYPLDSQLVIDPDECIDCSACVAECPVEAIYAEDELPADKEIFIEQNAVEAVRVKDEGAEPVVDQQDPMPGAEDRRVALGFG